MIYICAALECASIFEITVGLERGRKQTSITKILLCVLVYMLYFTIIMHLNLSSECAAFGYVVMYLCIKWLYRENLVHTLALTVLSAVFIAIIELLVLFVVFTIMQADESQMGVFEFAVTIPAFIISFLLSRSSINKVMYAIEKWDFTYAIVAILSLMIFAPELLLRFVRRLNVADYIYLAVCILIMWLLIARLQRYKIESKIRRQYFEAYKQVIEEIRRRQHKIKNQIDTAYSMFHLYHTYDELVANQKEYLSHILDYELPNDAIILEEPSVIALLYRKVNEAAEKDIKIETSFACSMLDSVVSDVLWVELIGTLFDNAIEALEDFEGIKKIWLEIDRTEKNKLSVKVSNTFREVSVSEINQFFQMGYTTKESVEDKERGIGLYNVKKIVSKYHGKVLAVNDKREEMNVITFEIIL